MYTNAVHLLSQWACCKRADPQEKAASQTTEEPSPASPDAPVAIPTPFLGTPAPSAPIQYAYPPSAPPLDDRKEPPAAAAPVLSYPPLSQAGPSFAPTCPASAYPASLCPTPETPSCCPSAPATQAPAPPPPSHNPEALLPPKVSTPPPKQTKKNSSIEFEHCSFSSADELRKIASHKETALSFLHCSFQDERLRPSFRLPNDVETLIISDNLITDQNAQHCRWPPGLKSVTLIRTNPLTERMVERLTDGSQNLESITFMDVDFGAIQEDAKPQPKESSCALLRNLFWKCIAYIQSTPEPETNGDRIFQALSRLKKLHTIKFIRCKNITPRNLSYLERVKKLTSFTLDHFDSFTDGMARSIGKILTLTSLNLLHTSIEDAFLSHLKNSELTLLDLTGSRKLHAPFTYLPPLSKLTATSFASCYDMGDKSISTDMRNFPALSKFYLTNSGLGNQGVQKLATLNLQYLDVSYNRLISDHGMSTLHKSSSLKVVKADGCAVTGVFLDHLPRQIERVGFQYCASLNPTLLALLNRTKYPHLNSIRTTVNGHLDKQEASTQLKGEFRNAELSL